MQKMLLVRECQVCGKNDFTPLVHLKGFPVLDYPIDKKLKEKIRRMGLPRLVPLEMDYCCCGHIVLRERLSDELLKIVYEHCYDVACAGINKGFGVEDQNYFLSSYDRFVRNNKAIGGKLLEIGCYDGSILKELKNRYSLEAYGCNPGNHIGKETEKEINFIEGYFDAESFPGLIFH